MDTLWTHTHTKTRPTQNLGFTTFWGKLSFKRIHNNLSIELQNNLQLGEQIVSYIYIVQYRYIYIYLLALKPFGDDSPYDEQTSCSEVRAFVLVLVIDPKQSSQVRSNNHTPKPRTQNNSNGWERNPAPVDTRWCPPVVSWFINPINYSYKYDKP